MIGRDIPLPLPVPDWSKPIILALLLLSAGFGLRARLAARRARGLEQRQRALTADLLAMQSALVPALPPRLGDVEISAAYSPADGPAAGGDFYDAFSLDGDRVAIILGDVSGHGRDAIAHAARMRYTVRAYVEAGLAPREALKLAGAVIGSSSDGLFTTVAVAIHDVTAACLTYATAGHPPPLATGKARHDPVTVGSPPLGWGVPCGRHQTTIPFPAGASACFFSDGLIEARTDADFLGREGLAELFERLDSPPSARSLLEAVKNHARQIRDDMAACIIKSAQGPRGLGIQTRLEELELDPAQLALGNGHRFLESCGVAANEIPEAIARATSIATDHGLALLAVTLPDRSWRVTTSVVVAIAPSSPSSEPDHPSLSNEPAVPAGRPPSPRRPGRFVAT